MGFLDEILSAIDESGEQLFDAFLAGNPELANRFAVDELRDSIRIAQ